MAEYDAFELLKRSGAKLPTDNYEFVKWGAKYMKINEQAQKAK